MARRVWDQFVTDQDRAHLELRPARGRRLGDRPALLLIDLYRWVFGDEPQPLLEAVKTWPGSCGLAAWDALPHIQRLLAEVRAADIPVVHFTGTDSLPGWRDITRDSAQPGELTGAAAERLRRRDDIVDEVRPMPTEPVIRKSAPSAFWGTPLAGYLNLLKVDTLLVAGETTSGCVRATVVDASSHRYNVLVVEECVFDRHQASHAISLFDMHHKYAEVLSLDKAIEYIRNHAVSAP